MAKPTGHGTEDYWKGLLEVYNAHNVTQVGCILSYSKIHLRAAPYHFSICFGDQSKFFQTTRLAYVLNNKLNNKREKLELMSNITYSTVVSRSFHVWSFLRQTEGFVYGLDTISISVLGQFQYCIFKF